MIVCWFCRHLDMLWYRWRWGVEDNICGIWRTFTRWHGWFLSFVVGWQIHSSCAFHSVPLCPVSSKNAKCFWTGFCRALQYGAIDGIPVVACSFFPKALLLLNSPERPTDGSSLLGDNWQALSCIWMRHPSKVAKSGCGCSWGFVFELDANLEIPRDPVQHLQGWWRLMLVLEG